MKLIIKLRMSNKNKAFCLIYWPPKFNFNNLAPDFDNTFSDFLSTVDEIFCLGDFNINLMNPLNPLIPFLMNLHAYLKPLAPSSSQMDEWLLYFISKNF